MANNIDYKTLKQSDQIEVLALCYTEVDGTNTLAPGVYTVSDVPELVLQVGIWRLYKAPVENTTKSTSVATSRKTTSKPQETLVNEEGKIN